jgi:ABC-2 type transport system ATP-binding protein
MSEAVVVQNVTKKFSSQYQSLSRRIPGTGLTSHSLMGSRQPAFSALEDVTFRVQSGEIFGLVGPHGSGKTTLVHLLGGLLPPDNGTLQVFGHDIVRHPAQARVYTNRISGQASFFQRLSAVENLAYGANQAGLSSPEARRRGTELLIQLGVLPHELNLPLVALPRSLYQKVALVSALLSQSRLLLLDEPFKGMTRPDRQRAQSLLTMLSKRDGVTILFATRDIDQARLFCDRLARLEKGRIVGEERLEFQDSRQSSRFARSNWKDTFQDSFSYSEIQKEELW